ncbi:hypothetical protein F4778DRAFT_408680 [Xylariomycetidae sp. FL2044]|nr:hypothetical protein F4778DRAFT_408680 [Xylariomycetidae sp. FL2044]
MNHSTRTGNRHLRQWISEFREAHSQQKWRECQFTAMMFVESCWKLHLDNFSKDRHEHNSILWVFVCVSQLMLASLPIQSSSETVQGPSINVQYHPSLEAAATGTAQFTFNYDQIYRISKTYRKTPLDGPNPNPREFLQSFQAVYNVEKDRPKVPQAWIDALARAADAIEVARRQNPSPTIHAPFEFVIPPYESSPVWNQYKYDPGIGSLRSPFNSPLLAKMALASEESQGEPSKYTTSTLGFFTVGEITDHLTTRDAWVVESDGDGGFDVYNITDAVRGAGWSDRQYRSLLVWSPTMCPMLTPYDIEADKIRREFGKSNRRIGKQTLEFYPEEIAENNGQDSKPLWVVLRGWVYDISKFPFSDAPERELLLRAVRGEFTTQPPSNEDDLPEDLMRRLSYHRCGLVKFKKGRRAFLQPMTLSSLRWHDNPSARVLIAIDQTIYDITEYIESHPGGRSLLLTAGGKDQTAEFYRSHQKNTLQDFADLVYARLVPEIDLTDIQADQIVLHDWVYDVKDLNDPEIHPYLGTDASAILTASPSSAASVGLTRLYLDRSRVVAKILATAAKRRRLPTITEGEIRANYADVDSLNGAFVTVSSDVYDVTDIMKYPEFYRYTIPRGYAGEPLLDAQLAAWLASEHAERRVGRLVSGAATHEFPRHINKPSLRDWIAQVSSLSV